MMADAKLFQVIDGPLSIRKEADGERTGKFIKSGDQVKVAGELVTKGGYIWAQHAGGWSAVSDDDGVEIYMLDISNRDPNAPRIFRVQTSTLSIRDAANGKRLKPKLKRKMEVTVKPDSRTEAGRYVWWEHDQGWSAERSVNGNAIFMKEVFDEPSSLELPPEKKAKIPDHWKGIMSMQVADSVWVRSKPTTDNRVMRIIRVDRGKVLECNMDTIVEEDGYYWVRHEIGWSAIMSTNGKDVFLAEPGTIPGLIAIGPNGPAAKDLPGYQSLITRLPVGLKDTEWFQYFGNNMYAMRKGNAYGYDRYSQGLHGGLDFGNSTRPVPIYAGVDGEFAKVEYPSKNNTRIFIKSGDYTLIYQHVTSVGSFSKGQAVTPDTRLALVEHHSINNGWNHLHFEVRFMKEWIVNPLLLLKPDLLTELLERFNPEKPNTSYRLDFPKSVSNFFYKTETWTRWTRPLDQPMIKRGGEVIGPRGELDKSEW